MLTIYTYPQPRMKNMIDLSTIPLNELAETACDIVAHQTNVQLWFGYLDGWMLSPHEEILLRNALRKFECHVVSLFPSAFSQSWKMEVRTVYTEAPHGDSDSNHDGSLVHNGNQIGYGYFSS